MNSSQSWPISLEVKYDLYQLQKFSTRYVPGDYLLEEKYFTQFNCIQEITTTLLIYE